MDIICNISQHFRWRDILECNFDFPTFRKFPNIQFISASEEFSFVHDDSMITMKLILCGSTVYVCITSDVATKLVNVLMRFSMETISVLYDRGDKRVIVIVYTTAAQISSESCSVIDWTNYALI